MDGAAVGRSKRLHSTPHHITTTGLSSQTRWPPSRPRQSTQSLITRRHVGVRGTQRLASSLQACRVAARPCAGTRKQHLLTSRGLCVLHLELLQETLPVALGVVPQARPACKGVRQRVAGNAIAQVQTMDNPTHPWAQLTLAHTAGRALQGCIHACGAHMDATTHTCTSDMHHTRTCTHAHKHTAPLPRPARA